MDPVSICKTDLVVFAPAITGKLVTFSWKTYPGAAIYTLIDPNGNLTYTSTTSITVTIPPGSYQWTVQAGPACSVGYVNFTVP
jgi:hypothetical protein